MFEKSGKRLTFSLNLLNRPASAKIRGGHRTSASMYVVCSTYNRTVLITKQLLMWTKSFFLFNLPMSFIDTCLKALSSSQLKSKAMAIAVKHGLKRCSKFTSYILLSKKFQINCITDFIGIESMKEMPQMLYILNMISADI